MTDIRIDYPELVSAKPPLPANVGPLVDMAIRAHPVSRSHRAKWLKAVRFLRRRKLWVLDGGRAQWGIPGEAA